MPRMRPCHRWAGIVKLPLLPAAPDPTPCTLCYAPMPCQRHTVRDASHDVWVPSIGGAIPGSFHNATRAAELVALGLVPAREVAPPRPLAEARQSRPAPERRPNVAAEKTPTLPKSLQGLSKAKLRDKLLATITYPDSCWVHEYGHPQRENGENRETFIRRVLS